MYRMPEKLASADLISAIKIEENGEEQSVHCDAEKPGNSVLTALVERQSVLVLFGGFRGMVILNRLTPDRKEATNCVRSRLAALTHPRTFSEDEWVNTVEPCVWEYLVHQQFAAEKLPPFEIVRVPLEISDTIILDNRCPHAGDRWLGIAGSLYRWHFYGFDRNIEMQGLEIAQESSETTVDLCEPDLLPIVTWTQALFK